MNILQLSKEFTLGGLSTSIIDLSTLLNNNGHKSIILTSYGEQLQYIDNNNLIYHMINFKSKNPFVIIKNILTIKKYIRIYNIDVIHSHNRICSLYIKILKIIKKTPMVWSVQQERIPSSYLFRKMTYYDKKVIVPTLSIKKYVNESLNIPSKDIALVFNGINNNNLKKASNIDIIEIKKTHNITNELIFTLLGRFAEVKGHEVLVKAFNNIKNKDKIKIVFVGVEKNDYYKKINSLIHDLGLKKYFLFLPYTPQELILSITDLMILPSHKDGITLAALSSFVMGVPVIKTKTSGYEELIDMVELIDIGDYMSLSKRMEEFVENPEKYQKIAENAKKLYYEKFDINIMLEKILKIYNEAIGEIKS